MKLRTTLAFLTGALISTASFAQVWNQPWDGASIALPSQKFPDMTAFDVLCFDDIQLSNTTTINAATFYGVELGLSSQNISVEIGFASSPNVSSIFISATGTQVGNNLVFSGLNINLAPGQYYVTAYVVRSFGSGGQWTWKQTIFANASGGLPQAYMHNPGNGFGWGSNPLPVSTVTGIPRQMTMFIQ